MTKDETVGYVFNLGQHTDQEKYIISFFSTQIGYITSMMDGGKISPKIASKKIKKVYKNYKKTFKQLREINETDKKSNPE